MNTLKALRLSLMVCLLLSAHSTKLEVTKLNPVVNLSPTLENAKILTMKQDGFLLFVNGMTDRKAGFSRSRLLAFDDGDGQDHGPTFPPDPRDYDCGTCPWYYCLLWPFPCL